MPNSFWTFTGIYEAHPVVFRTNPDIFRTKPFIYKTNTVIFRTNPFIFLTIQVIIGHEGQIQSYLGKSSSIQDKSKLILLKF